MPDKWTETAQDDPQVVEVEPHASPGLTQYDALAPRSLGQITCRACTITLTLRDTIKTFACPSQLIFETFL